MLWFFFNFWAAKFFVLMLIACVLVACSDSDSTPDPNPVIIDPVVSAMEHPFDGLWRSQTAICETRIDFFDVDGRDVFS